MKFYLLIIAVLTFLISQSCSKCSSVDIKLSIDKAEYVLGEPIVLEILAINNSKQDLFFAPFALRQLKIYDSSGNGNIYTYNLWIDIIYNENFKAGDTLSKRIELTSNFGKRHEKSSVSSFPCNDSYRIQLLFADESKNVNAVSNVINFSVIEQNTIQEKIFNEYCIASKERDRSQARFIYDSLINKYPNSIYLPLFYFKRLLLDRHTNFSSGKTYHDLSVDAIYNCANSPTSYRFISHFVHYYKVHKDKKGAEAALRKIIDDNLSPFVNKYVSTWYNRIRSQSVDEFNGKTKIHPEAKKILDKLKANKQIK